MNEDISCIKENLVEIRQRVSEAALKSGRKSDAVKLIAVTKTVATDRILIAAGLGISDFGENRVQELCEKYDIVGSTYNWHLIGHLQTNKVKYIIDKVTMIHSLDRLELAEEIQKRAAGVGKAMDVLVQVNIAEEESKSGLSIGQVPDFLRAVSAYENIKVRGLMTIAPLAKDPEDVRWVFSALKKLLIDMDKENIDNIDMDYLSMGMSNDFEVAIEEGSNIVRIGTSIFGKR
jgi:pyridoxal phosphate enzyme (YggS family)